MIATVFICYGYFMAPAPESEKIKGAFRQFVTEYVTDFATVCRWLRIQNLRKSYSLRHTCNMLRIL